MHLLEFYNLHNLRVTRKCIVGEIVINRIKTHLKHMDCKTESNSNYNINIYTQFSAMLI